MIIGDMSSRPIVKMGVEAEIWSVKCYEGLSAFIHNNYSIIRELFIPSHNIAFNFVTENNSINVLLNVSNLRYQESAVLVEKRQLTSDEFSALYDLYLIEELANQKKIAAQKIIINILGVSSERDKE